MLAWVLLGAMFARTTDTGTIGGVVTDPSGAVIPEVTVNAVSTSTLLARAATTNTQGSFVFLNLPVGTYAVSFHKESFRDVRKTGVVIDVNTALRVDAALQVGGVRQEVMVSSNLVQVETTQTDLPQTRRGILERLCQ